MNDYYVVQLSDYSTEVKTFRTIFDIDNTPLFLLVGDNDIIVISKSMDGMQLKKEDNASIEAALSWQDKNGKPHHLRLKRYAIAELCELIRKE